LPDAVRIELFLVGKSDRLELKYRFAGFIHGLDVVLVASRRLDRAELTRGIDEHCDGTRTRDRFTRDTADVGGGLSRFANASGVGLSSFAEQASADDDVIAASGEVQTGLITQGGVVQAIVVKEGLKTHGGVVVAGGVIIERLNTAGR